MYSSSLVCIAGNYWLAAGSRSLRDLGDGVPVASRPRGRGVRSEPGVTLGARGPQRWRGTGSGTRGPQARNQSIPTHKLMCRKVTF